MVSKFELALNSLKQKMDVTIVETQHSTITRYQAIKDGEEIADIQLSITNVQVGYETNDPWFTPSRQHKRQAIVVTWLSSKVKGYGLKMLAYGVLSMQRKHPRIIYSVLDDNSEKSTHMVDNIYSRFGYRPVNFAKKLNNSVELNGPEKQVLLIHFLEKVIEMFDLDVKQSMRFIRSNQSKRSQRSQRTISRAKTRKSHRVIEARVIES